MPEFDTIIRGGLIVDGTGGAAFYHDVGVRDGRIAEVGALKGRSAAEEIDATGKIVAPGIVTQHSHYDAMIFWNPYCSNSGENGVTTVANANCGFGFAPVRERDRERTMAMMETTEQIPVAHQRSALAWDWESFPEFLDRTRAIPKGVNVLTYMPMNPLMIYVMGIEGAKTRRPTPAEMQEMHRLINEAMDAGALGISISIMGAEGNSHVDFDGTSMPTDAMHPDDAVELGRALAERGEGLIQLLSRIAHFGDWTISERMAEMAKGSGVRVVHNILSTQLADEELAWLKGLRDRGLDITGQTIGYRGWVEGGVHDLDVSAGQLPAIREIVACQNDEQIKSLIADPAYRARFEEQYEAAMPSSGAFGLASQSVIDVGGVAGLEKYLGRTLADIAAERGTSVVVALFDLAVASNLAVQIKSGPIALDDPRVVVRMMQDPAVTIGVSDGGAHTKSHSLGHYGTDFLIWLVREEKLVRLEEMHFQLSLKPAQALGLKDRGALLPGFWADMVIYDLDRLYVDFSRMEILHDMPGGDWRRRTVSGGYHRILVNGVTTHIDDRPTGATPGVSISPNGKRARNPRLVNKAA